MTFMKALDLIGSLGVAGALMAWTILAPSARGQAYESGFEPPRFTGSASGESVVGQDAWYNPIAGSTPGLVFTQSGNAFGVASSPIGSAQFLGTRSGGGTAFGRAERLGMTLPARTTVCYDVNASFAGVLPATQNLGSFSAQPTVDSTMPTIKGWVQLNTWADLATATTWNAGYLAYTSAGVQFAQPGAIAGPAWMGLETNRWYRLCTTVDFDVNRIIEVSITDLATGVTTVAHPTAWYVGGGAGSTLPRPTGGRFFAGGPTAGNTVAWDNLVAFQPPFRCPCDWNLDGVLNSADFFDFLNSFFEGSADFNGDGVTNSADFFEFVNCVFAGCVDVPPPAPEITTTVPASPSGETMPRLIGSAETGTIVRIYANGACAGAPIATGTAEAFATEGIAVTVAPGSTTTFHASATDSAGRVSVCSEGITYRHVEEGLRAPVFTGTIPPSRSDETMPALVGVATPGTTVRIHTDAGCKGEAIASGSAEEFETEGITVFVAPNTSGTFYASATDAEGNVSECSDGITYVHAGAAPTMFEGPGDEPANRHIPNIPFPLPVGAEFLPDAEMGGFRVCVKQFVLMFRPTATVAEANQLLMALGGSIVGADSTTGALMIRVPALQTIEDIDLTLAALEADPIVLGVAPDTEISVDRVTNTAGAPAAWRWGVPPAGGNWGLEGVRAPQAWNLRDWLVRRGRTPRIGFIDTSFEIGHQDLDGLSAFVPAGGQPNDRERGFWQHGTQVAGAAMAGWGNGLGIDGIIGATNTRGVGMPATELPRLQPKGKAGAAAWGKSFISDFSTFVKAHPDIRVFSISLGYAWFTHHGITPTTNEKAQSVVRRQAACFEKTFVALPNHERRLVVGSAGNDHAMVSAQWNSPMCYLAVNRGSEQMLCIGATQLSSGGGYERADFSNTGPSMSAPGEDVLLTYPDNMYRSSDGTSFATPYVAGAAAYLLAYDPGRIETIPVLHGLLRSPGTTRAVPGVAGMMDLYAAILGIDSLPGGNNQVHKELVDVSDGSTDGNARVDHDDDNRNGNFTEIVTTVSNSYNNVADSFRGDGRVDMRDFRAFRDALLQALVELGEANGGLRADQVSLDGGDRHFKKDLNFDGCVGGNPANPGHPAGTIPGQSSCANAAAENVYPRYDFNGDGKLNGHKVMPDAAHLAPFRVDPDTDCTGLGTPAGCVRDIDVIGDARVWQLDDERVSVTIAADMTDFPTPPPPLGMLGWRPTVALMADRDRREVNGAPGPSDGIIDYVFSCDVHIAVGPVPAEYIGYEELEISVHSDLPDGVDNNGNGMIDEPWERSFARYRWEPNPGGETFKTIVTMPLYSGRVAVKLTFVNRAGPPPPLGEAVTVFGVVPQDFPPYNAAKFGHDIPVRWPMP